MQISKLPELQKIAYVVPVICDHGTFADILGHIQASSFLSLHHTTATNIC